MCEPMTGAGDEVMNSDIGLYLSSEWHVGYRITDHASPNSTVAFFSTVLIDPSKARFVYNLVSPRPLRER
jgi:hypothetical protein